MSISVDCRLLILWPYAVASPMYTYGQFCFVMQAHNNFKVSLCASRPTTRSGEVKFALYANFVLCVGKAGLKNRSASSQALVRKLNKYHKQQ